MVDVRVRGAIGVVELDSPTRLRGLGTACVARGAWLRPFGRIAYLTPALTISPADLQHLMRVLREALREVRPEALPLGSAGA